MNAVTLTPAEATSLARYLVGRNAAHWELDWETFPGIDQQSATLLNEAINSFGERILTVGVALDEVAKIDGAELLERATR